MPATCAQVTLGTHADADSYTRTQTEQSGNETTRTASIPHLSRLSNQWASNCTFPAPGFNNLCKKNFVKVYMVDDHICVELEKILLLLLLVEGTTSIGSSPFVQP